MYVGNAPPRTRGKQLGFIPFHLKRMRRNELGFVPGSTPPTDPTIPYMIIFKGDNFDGPSQITTDVDIIPSPEFDHQVGSLVVWGDWSVFAREARNSKRGSNPDVTTILTTGQYNADRLKGQSLYKRITNVKPVGPPPTSAQPQSPPPPPPPPPPVVVQPPPVQPNTAVNPAPIINLTPQPSGGSNPVINLTTPGAPASALPPWLIPVGIGGALLLLMQMKKSK